MTKRLFAFCVLVGVVGFLLTWGAWHLYVDHQRIDAVWQLELNRDAAARAQVK